MFNKHIVYASKHRRFFFRVFNIYVFDIRIQNIIIFIGKMPNIFFLSPLSLLLFYCCRLKWGTKNISDVSLKNVKDAKEFHNSKHIVWQEKWRGKITRDTHTHARARGQWTHSIRRDGKTWIGHETAKFFSQRFFSFMRSTYIYCVWKMCRHIFCFVFLLIRCWTIGLCFVDIFIYVAWFLQQNLHLRIRLHNTKWQK